MISFDSSAYDALLFGDVGTLQKEFAAGRAGPLDRVCLGLGSTERTLAGEALYLGQVDIFKFLLEQCSSTSSFISALEWRDILLLRLSNSQACPPSEYYDKFVYACQILTDTQISDDQLTDYVPDSFTAELLGLSHVSIKALDSLPPPYRVLLALRSVQFEPDLFHQLRGSGNHLRLMLELIPPAEALHCLVELLK